MNQLYVYIYLLFFRFPSHLGHHRAMSGLSCAVLEVLSGYLFYVHAQLLQSFLTLCDHMDCSPPGSTVHGVLQARILEWVAVPFSRGSSWPRDWTQVSCISCIAGEFFTRWVTWEALSILYIESAVCVCQSQSLNSSHPLSPSWYPQAYFLCLCLYFCFADKITFTIFLNSTHMH